jgi:Protein of unknown function (DUF3352)
MPVHSDHRPGRRVHLATALLIPALAAAMTGCGSSHSSGTATDPAGAIPASAPLYAGAVVRPTGTLKTAASTAGRTFTRQADPYLRLLTALQTPGSATLDFNRDVAPWLGPDAGIFLSSLNVSEESRIGGLLSQLARGLLGGASAANAFPFGAHGVQGAIVLDTSDAGKARSFLESQAKRAGARAASYRGVAYQVTGDGIAFAVVDRLAVIGSEAGLHSVIDTTLGGPSLAQAAGYAKLAAVAPKETLAHLYVNPSASNGSGASGGSAGPLGLLVGTRETNISLVPTTTSIGLDADALTSSSASTPASGGLLASVSQGAQAAGELPGDSWLALGLGNVGAALGGDVQGLRGLVSLASSLGGSSAEAPATGALSLNSLLEAILKPISLLGADTAEARRDFESWMGSAGIFASGTGIVNLKAGIVITSKNPSLSRAAVAKLGTLLSKSGASVQPVSIPGAQAAVSVELTGLPVTLDVVDARAANGQTKFVLGLSEASVTAALNPSSTLSSSASYSAASTVLGEGIRPSITVDFPTFLSLLEGVGLSEEPTIAKLVPYLRTLTTLAGGGNSPAAGIERLRIVLGLQHPE